MDTVSVNIVITSIETTYMSSSIQIYPNPTSQNLQISFNSNSLIDVSIFDTLGKKVLDFKKIASGDLISIESLENGMYYFKPNNSREHAFVVIH